MNRVAHLALSVATFSAAERKELELNVDRVADATEALVLRGLEAAQNAYND